MYWWFVTKIILILVPSCPSVTEHNTVFPVVIIKLSARFQPAGKTLSIFSTVIVISFVLVILSDILILNYPKGFLNIVYEIISLLSLFVTNLLYNYVTEQDSVIIVICLIFVIILSVLFYSFVLFKTLNNIIVKDKHIKEEKYGL